MTADELAVWQTKDSVLALIGLNPSAAPRVLVSETLRESEDATEGVWDRSLRAVIVKRSQLRSLDAFAGTLLHELAHALTGTDDCTRAFENVLTRYLGKVASRSLAPASAFPPSEGATGPTQPVAAPASPPLDPIGLRFIPVQSSSIEAVAYDSPTNALFVTFRSGSRNFYRGVPASLFTALLTAPSKGKFLNSMIVGRYEHGVVR